MKTKTLKIVAFPTFSTGKPVENRIFFLKNPIIQIVKFTVSKNGKEDNKMRGVNKLIVEIKDTENEYFDRAILFVKPDKAVSSQSELDQSARRLLSAVKSGKDERRKRRVWIPLCVGGGIIAAGAALLLIF